MLDRVTQVLVETIDTLDVLNEKIAHVDKHESDMTWEVYEVANQELNNDIVVAMEYLEGQFAFLDEQLENLNQAESDMTTEAYDLAWDMCDNAYAILLDYQTELVGKQADYSMKLLQGYSEQLEGLGFESNEENAMRNAVKQLKDMIWKAIKKGAAYAWDNKEKWHQIIMEKGYEIQDDLLAEKSKAEAAVERASIETVKNNVQDIQNKHRNGEALSMYEKYYFQAAKEKLGI